MLSLTHLLFDVILITSTSYLWSTLCVKRSVLFIETRLVCGAVFAFAQIVCAGLLFGYTGSLTLRNITIFHAITALVTTIRCRRYIRKEARGFRVLQSPIRFWSGLLAQEKMLGIAAFAPFALLLIPALLGEPQVHDSLSYRLSRIGYWLQEKQIFHFVTNEERQNYMPVNTDLIMAWLVMHFREGFPLVALVQFAGGILTALATWGLCRELGLERQARLGAVLVFIAMPNVTAQVTISQTDLQTGAFATSGIYLLLLALRGQITPVPGWLALGLGIGAKTTILFWLPGLLVMGVIWFFIHKPSRRSLVTHFLLAGACITLLGLPRYVENMVSYGNPFGSPQALELNVGGTGGNLVKKAVVNGFSFFIQIFEPASNPLFFRPGLEPIWLSLIETLPAANADPFAIQAYPRRKSMVDFGQAEIKNADVLSCGVIAGLLTLLGATISAYNWFREHSKTSLVWFSLSISLAGFICVFSALMLWWPVHFRYFCMVAGAMAALSAYAVTVLLPRHQFWLWAIVAILTVFSVLEVATNTFNAGYKTLPRARVLYDYQLDLIGQKRAIQDSVPANARLGVLLPWNSVLAGLFRNSNIIDVQMIPFDTTLNADLIFGGNNIDALLTRPGLLPANTNLTIHEIRTYADEHPRFLVFVRKSL